MNGKATLARWALRAAVGGLVCVGGWLLSILYGIAFDEPGASIFTIVFLLLTLVLMTFAAIAEMIAHPKPPAGRGFEVIVANPDEPT